MEGCRRDACIEGTRHADTFSSQADYVPQISMRLRMVEQQTLCAYWRTEATRKQAREEEMLSADALRGFPYSIPR